MGHRSERFRIRALDAAEAKLINRKYKNKERTRRDARMLDTVKSGELPYTPLVMSWLSTQLDKKSSKITPQDVKSLLSA